MFPFTSVLCLNLYSGIFMFIIKISNFGVCQELLFSSPVRAANRWLMLTEIVNVQTWCSHESAWGGCAGNLSD